MTTIRDNFLAFSSAYFKKYSSICKIIQLKALLNELINLAYLVYVVTEKIFKRPCFLIASNNQEFSFSSR